MKDWFAVALLVAVTAWMIRIDADTWIVAICVAAASGTLALMIATRIVAARRKRRQ